MGQGGTLFHKGVTTRDPRVPRNLSFHPRGEHRGHGGHPGTGGGLVFFKN